MIRVRLGKENVDWKVEVVGLKYVENAKKNFFDVARGGKCICKSPHIQIDNSNFSRHKIHLFQNIIALRKVSKPSKITKPKIT